MSRKLKKYLNGKEIGNVKFMERITTEDGKTMALIEATEIETGQKIECLLDEIDFVYDNESVDLFGEVAKNNIDLLKDLANDD